MTIGEALARSKETGELFMRQNSSREGVLIDYVPGYVFRWLKTEDLMADDWVELSTVGTTERKCP